MPEACAAWADICAAVSAQRYARSAVVTASIDELHFLRPIRMGMVVILRAQVNQAWRTSMEIGVRIEGEDPRSGAREHCCSAYLTFCALDDLGHLAPLPVFVPQDPDEARRAAEADERRRHRLEVRESRRK